MGFGFSSWVALRANRVMSAAFSDAGTGAAMLLVATWSRGHRYAFWELFRGGRIAVGAGCFKFDMTLNQVELRQKVGLGFFPANLSFELPLKHCTSGCVAPASTKHCPVRARVSQALAGTGRPALLSVLFTAHEPASSPRLPRGLVAVPPTLPRLAIYCLMQCHIIRHLLRRPHWRQRGRREYGITEATPDSLL